MRVVVLLLSALCTPLFAQRALTFDQIVQRFRMNNPALLAGQLSVQESQANEVTAGLRPNPQFSLILDQFQISGNPFRPFVTSQIIPAISQLIERRNKRGLRVESSRLATAVARTDQQDLERTLLFSLRDAFNRVLLGRSVVELARENLKYYDHVIAVNQERYKAGDISKIDFQRVELQKVQFQSDLANAEVNLRTAKIQLLALMNERSPLDSFDISGNFDYKEQLILPEEVRQAALATRPDLQSASTLVQKALTDHRLAWANGSTDPVVSIDYGLISKINTAGVGINFPLRIFDRNQGEKARTQIDITRTQRLRENLVAGIYRDVDSAYAQLQTVLSLLRPYKQTYLEESREVRDLVSFSFSNGGASLLEFLDAQRSYRDTQLAYRNLIGSYLSAVAQLNLAVGREVAQ
jgi:cobalt-zinc-cadmium efflux system outer membrane protein